MKSRILVLSVIVIMVLSTFISAGCSSSPSAKGPIKIGVLVDLTGPIGPGGIDAKKGIDLAMETLAQPINGRQIQYVVEDAASDPGVTMDKAKKLVETDKVNVIIGPVNAGGLIAVSQYAAQVKVPDLPIVNDPTDAAKSQWEFIPSGLELQQGYPVGVYAYDVLGYRTVVGLGADFSAGHDYLAAFDAGFESRGGKVIEDTYYPEGSSNFVPYFTALKQADCLDFWGTPGDMFNAFPQYKELNLKIPILQPEDGGVTSSPGMLKNLGSAAIGDVFSSGYFYNADTPGNSAFVDAYQKKYNELPSVMSGCGYANVQEVLAALKATNGDTSPDALFKAFQNLSVDTIRGHVQFNGSNVADYTSMIGTITPDMQIKLLKTYTVHVENQNGTWVPTIKP